MKKGYYEQLIIGAGPAGLTAAYELTKAGEKNFLVLEKRNQVGGLAATRVFKDFRYDIGPHRFFTKNKEIDDLFLEVLGDDAIKVNRLTRILFKGTYFNYPLSPFNALFGLGVLNSIIILFSYISARIKSMLKLNEINNFEDWVVDKFGKKLYMNFFKNYTEKVWGIDCKDIGKDWASQRIKGLSLMTALRNALFPNSKNKPKSLIDTFYYPKLGAGMLWEKFESILVNNNIEVMKESEVVNITKESGDFKIAFRNKNIFKTVYAKHIFFSNPLLQFINIFDNKTPENVIEAAQNLRYRNHISVHLCINEKLFDDNWIYVHSPDLKVARISDFSNFSKSMSPKDTYTLTLEYFCFEHDPLWSYDKTTLINLAASELQSIFNSNFEILHSEITKSTHAYPVIEKGYEDKIETIKDWVKSQKNISAIGRSGMFKYNNQDHAMATGLSAVRRYLGDDVYDPWLVNIDGEYIEQISNDSN